MGFVLGSLRDPLLEDLDLAGLERFVGLRRWHDVVGIMRDDADDHLVVIGVVGDVETDVPFAFLLVGAVTGKAIL